MGDDYTHDQIMMMMRVMNRTATTAEESAVLALQLGEALKRDLWPNGVTSTGEPVPGWTPSPPPPQPYVSENMRHQLLELYDPARGGANMNVDMPAVQQMFDPAMQWNPQAFTPMGPQAAGGPLSPPVPGLIPQGGSPVPNATQAAQAILGDIAESRMAPAPMQTPVAGSPYVHDTLPQQWQGYDPGTFVPTGPPQNVPGIHQPGMIQPPQGELGVMRQDVATQGQPRPVHETGMIQAREFLPEYERPETQFTEPQPEGVHEPGMIKQQEMSSVYKYPEQHQPAEVTPEQATMLEQTMEAPKVSVEEELGAKLQRARAEKDSIPRYQGYDEPLETRNDYLTWLFYKNTMDAIWDDPFVGERRKQWKRGELEDADNQYIVPAEAFASDASREGWLSPIVMDAIAEDVGKIMEWLPGGGSYPNNQEVFETARAAANEIRNSPFWYGQINDEVAEQLRIQGYDEKDIQVLRHGVGHGIKRSNAWGWLGANIIDLTLTRMGVNLLAGGAIAAGAQSVKGGTALTKALEAFGRGWSAQGRTGAAMIGVLEGLPTDVAIALKNKNEGIGTVGFGAVIGGLSGAFLPGVLGNMAPKDVRVSTTILKALNDAAKNEQYGDQFVRVLDGLATLAVDAPSLHQVARRAFAEAGADDTLLKQVDEAMDPVQATSDAVQTVLPILKNIADGDYEPAVKATARKAVEEVEDMNAAVEAAQKVATKTDPEAIDLVLETIRRGDQLELDFDSQRINSIVDIARARAKEAGSETIELTLKEEEEVIDEIKDQAAREMVDLMERIQRKRLASGAKVETEGKTGVPKEKGATDEYGTLGDLRELGVTVGDFADANAAEMFTRVYQNPAARQVIRDARNLYRRGAIDATEAAETMRLIVREFGQLPQDAAEGVLPARTASDLVQTLMDAKKNVTFKGKGDLIDMLYYRWHDAELPEAGPAEGEFWASTLKLKGAEAQKFIENVWPKLQYARHLAIGQMDQMDTRGDLYRMAPFRNQRNTMAFVVEKLRQAKAEGVLDGKFVDNLVRQFRNIEMWNSASRYSILRESMGYAARMAPTWRRKAGKFFESWKKMSKAKKLERAREWYLRSESYEGTVTPRQFESATSGAEPTVPTTRQLRRPKGLPKKTDAERTLPADQGGVPTELSGPYTRGYSDVDIDVDVPEDKVLLERYEAYLNHRWDFYKNFKDGDASHVANLVRILNEFENNRWISREEMWMSIDNPHWWFPEAGAGRNAAIKEARERGLTKMMYGPGTSEQKEPGIMDIMSHQSGLESKILREEIDQVTYDRTHMRYDPNAEQRWHGTDPLPDQRAAELTLGGPERVSPEGRFRAFAQKEIEKVLNNLFAGLRGKRSRDPRYNKIKDGVETNRQQLHPNKWRGILRGKNYARRFPGFGHDGSRMRKSDVFVSMVDNAGNTGIKVVDRIPRNWNEVFTLDQVRSLVGEFETKDPQWRREIRKHIQKTLPMSDVETDKWVDNLFTGIKKLEIYASQVEGETVEQVTKLQRSRLGPRGLVRRLTREGFLDPVKGRKAKEWERPRMYPGLEEDEARSLIDEVYRHEEMGIIDKLRSLGYDNDGALQGLLDQFKVTREWTDPKARLAALERWTKEFIDTSEHVGGLPRRTAEFAGEYVEEDAFTEPLPILIGAAGQELRVSRKAIGGDQHIYTATDPLSGKDFRSRTLDGLQKLVDEESARPSDSVKQSASLEMERFLRESLKDVKRTPDNAAAFEVIDHKIDVIMSAIRKGADTNLTKEEMAEAAVALAEFLRASDNIELLPVGKDAVSRLRAEGYNRITSTLDLDIDQLKELGFTADEAFALIERGEQLAAIAKNLGSRKELEAALEEYGTYLKAFEEWLNLDTTGQVAREFAESGELKGSRAEAFVRQHGSFTDFYQRYKKGTGSNVDLPIEYLPAMIPGGIGAWMFADQDYSSKGWENEGSDWGAAGYMTAGIAMAVLGGKTGLRNFLRRAWGGLNMTKGRGVGDPGYHLKKYDFWNNLGSHTAKDKRPNWLVRKLTFTPGDKASRIIDHMIAGKPLGETLTWRDRAIVWTERMFTKLTNAPNLVARSIAHLSGQPLQKVQKDFQVARSFYVKAQHHLAEIMPKMLAMQGDDPRVKETVQGILDVHRLWELGRTGHIELGKGAQKALHNMVGDLHERFPREVALAYEVNRQYQAIVKLEYEAGLLTKQEFEDIVWQGQFYSPIVKRPGLEELDFYGLQDIDIASTPTAGLRSFVGSGFKLNDATDVDEFLQGAVNRASWEDMLVADVIGAHARIGRHSLNMGILDLAETARSLLKSGSLDDPLLSMIVDVTPVSQKMINNAKSAAEKTLLKEINDRILKVKNSPQFDKKHVITIKDIGLSPRHAEITNVERGTKRQIWVRSQDFIDYFASLEYDARNVDGQMTRAMTKFKNMKRWGVTVAPAFMLRNFLRDTMTAAIQRETVFSPIKRLATGNMETGQRDALRVGLAMGSAAAATGAAEIAAGDDDSAWKEIPIWVAAAAAGLPAAAIGDYLAFAAKDVGTGILHMMPIDTPLGQSLRKLAVRLRMTPEAEATPAVRGRAGTKLLRAIESERPIDIDKLDMDQLADLNRVEALIRAKNQAIYKINEGFRKGQIQGQDADNANVSLTRLKNEITGLQDERDALRNTAAMTEGELLITLYDELQNSGALSLGFYPLRGEDRVKLLKQLGARKNFITGTFTGIRDFWEGVGRSIETTNRYRLYREVSASPRGAFGYEDATFAAADGTLDFTKKGMSKEIKWMGKTTAFFNPAMLGVEKGWNIFMKDVATPSGAYAGGKKFNKDAMINTAMAVTAPSVALWYLNSEHAEYNSLPAWERETFWHIPLDGWGKEWLRIPKPFEVGYLFGTLPELLLSEAANVENLRKETDNPYVKASLGMMKDIAFALWKSGYSYGSFPMPDLPTWGVELATGRNMFTGMKFESPYAQGPQYLEGSTYDSTIGLMLAENAYRLTDGAINWSPARMDHLIWGPTATAGRLAAEATSGIARAADIDTRAAPVRRIDPLHGLIVQPSSRWHHEASVQDSFYRGRSIKSQMTEAMTNGDVKRYERLMGDHMQDLVVYEAMNAFMRDMDGFSKLRKQALDGTGMFMGWTPEKRQEAVFVMNQRVSGLWEAGEETIRLLKSRFDQ